MRHHDVKRKFGREEGVRRALLRSLAEALIKNEKITTTEARAKELRPYVEKLVTIGRKGTLASRRVLISRLGTEARAKRLAEMIAPRYKDRNGGYTRITKLQRRLSDGSKMAVIEFVK
ncbi:MAG: 50S ribosomal protein L17 [Candidatus Vogelbacteria bacterium]|nr:50S ribosomal protein L17 [Candidatus Vogelbacteria bacterium]